MASSGPPTPPHIPVQPVASPLPAPQPVLSERVQRAAPAPPKAAPAAPTQEGDSIIVENLEKTYPNGTHAVRGVSFRVRRGEIFGILGPNGAGKSTTIGILGTLVRPSKGKAVVDGIDVTKDTMEIRRRIGFAMQEAGIDDLATGREFLRLQGRLYSIPKKVIDERATELLKLFELEDAADKRIKAYSGGMKRRIDLAAALIHQPPILFLDEPTEGLDPRSRVALWSTLQRFNREQGTTILLSTHYMEEADKLCNRIAIIDQGLIVAQDTPARLKATVGGQSLALDYGTTDGQLSARAEKVLVAARVASRIVLQGSELVVYVPDAAAATPRVLQLLDRAGLPPKSLRIQQPTLEDVYLQYTGRRLEAAEAAA